MIGRHEVRSRVCRWRSIRIYEHGAAKPEEVVDEIATWLGDPDKRYCVVQHADARMVAVGYDPSFDDETRKIIHGALTKRFPAARQIGFYGEEAVVVLRAVVCLGEHVQGAWP